MTILADEEDDEDDLAIILELLEPSFSEEVISFVDTNSSEDALADVLSAHSFEGNGLSLQVSSLSIRCICLFFLSHKTNDCPFAVMRDLTME